jgi:hypothetical protein
MGGWQAMIWGAAMALSVVVFLRLVANEIACTELLVERYLGRHLRSEAKRAQERENRRRSEEAKQRMSGAQGQLMGLSRPVGPGREDAKGADAADGAVAADEVAPEAVEAPPVPPQAASA